MVSQINKYSNTSISGTVSVPWKVFLLDESSPYRDDFLCKMSICSPNSVPLRRGFPLKSVPLIGVLLFMTNLEQYSWWRQWHGALREAFIICRTPVSYKTMFQGITRLPEKWRHDCNWRWFMWAKQRQIGREGEILTRCWSCCRLDKAPASEEVKMLAWPSLPSHRSSFVKWQKCCSLRSPADLDKLYQNLIVWGVCCQQESLVPYSALTLKICPKSTVGYCRPIHKQPMWEYSDESRSLKLFKVSWFQIVPCANSLEKNEAWLSRIKWKPK